MTEILSALDLLPAPAVLVDERLRISGANEAARLLLPSISASSSLLDQAAVEDGDKLRNLVILCLDSPRSAAGLDLKLGSAAAERKWRNLQAKPVPGFQGFFVVTILDIHAAKTTQIETRHWEERWNAALVGSDLGVWDHDIRRGIYFYSGKWKEIRGLQRDSDVEADYETWIGAVHPDDRDRVRSYIEKQAAGDLSVTSCEYRERRADGEYVWIECRGACFETFSDGTAARIIGTDLDITARKEAEGQIERLKQRFELALEATRIGVFEADIADQTVQFDDTLLEILGFLPARTSWEETTGCTSSIPTIMSQRRGASTMERHPEPTSRMNSGSFAPATEPCGIFERGRLASWTAMAGRRSSAPIGM
nr:PAS domain-containing protein [Rhizobium sp. G21]